MCDSFQHAIFVDASSAKTIETGLIARLKSIDKSFVGNDLSTALEALSQPNDIVTTKWCVVFDSTLR